MATQIQSAKIVTEEIENAAGANPYSITLGTENTTTGGTAIDFIDIPSGVKRITVMFFALSASGAGAWLVQLGDSVGIETTGYVSRGGVLSLNATPQASTAGFIFNDAAGSADAVYGTMNFYLEDASGFSWVADGLRNHGIVIDGGAGGKSLSSELTQLRITIVSGSDTFDAGAINIQYQ